MERGEVGPRRGVVSSWLRRAQFICLLYELRERGHGRQRRSRQYNSPEMVQFFIDKNKDRKKTTKLV